MTLHKIALFTLIMLASTFSWGAECIQDGGDKRCIMGIPEEWSETYAICTVPESYWFDRTGNFYYETFSKTPTTELNIIERSKQYALGGGEHLKELIDYGWGNYFHPDCYRQGFEGIIPTTKHRKITTIVETNKGQKIFQHLYIMAHRDIGCPDNHKRTRDSSGSLMCIIPPKISDTCSVGNPCSISTGNKFQTETDWTSPNSPLKITRYYNSLHSDERSAWTHNYQASIEVGEIQDAQLLGIKEQSLTKANTAIVLIRPNGTRVVAQRHYTDSTLAGDTGWFIDRDLNLKLRNIDQTTWQVNNVKTGVTETYKVNFVADDYTPDPETEFYHFELARIDYPNGRYVTLDYHNNGKLNTVTDERGQQLIYHHNPTGTIANIDLTNGKQIQYQYDYNHQLTSVTRPSYGTKTYLYAEADKVQNDNPNLLTGIIDENGNRYATYAYDSSNRGILTEHAGGSQRFELSYNHDTANKSTTVYDENGSTRTYGLTLVSGSNRVSNQKIGNKRTDNQYDQAGNLTQKTENGINTRYTYDQTRNLRTATINAFGTPESTITLTAWHPTLPVKSNITEGTANTDGTLNQALRETSFTHDNRGNILTRTITDIQTGQSRTWTYTYNNYNQKLTETDPTGLTQYWDYTDDGYLKQYTDPQGLITIYSNHNADGKPQTITSPTGQATKLTYDEAGRVLNQTTIIAPPELNNLAHKVDLLTNIRNFWRRINNLPPLPEYPVYDITHGTTQTATTTYEYDPVGQLIRTTLPDGQVITYTYDDAHRLIGMTDSLGNRIDYTLNSAGDITQTNSYDPQGVLANTSKQTFDSLGRLDKQQGNNGQYQEYDYDGHDNPIQSNNALGQRTQSSYDLLNRKVEDTDPNNGKVNYAYDGLGNLISVTDPKGNTTSYVYNAFGELLETNSPDTGITTYEYDKGRLVKQTDATGREINYQYDRKGRIAYTRDNNNNWLTATIYNPQGQIQYIRNHSTKTDYVYDSANRIVTKTQTIHKQQQQINYRYTAGNKLKQIKLPSGKLIDYHYNKGVLSGISVDNTPVITNITYNPNGIANYTYAQTGAIVNYNYDLDGRLTNINDNALNRTINYDTGNRITDIFDNTVNISFNYQHDSLDRLIKQSLTNAETTDNISYVYDKNSNRTSKTTIAEDTTNVLHTPITSDSNKLADVTYDESGRILTMDKLRITYDKVGRTKIIMRHLYAQVHSSVHNTFNPLGQRIYKWGSHVPGGFRYFMYDETGQLLGEYDKEDNAVREYVYLGNMPVAMMSSERDGEVLQVHTDHLGTPRAVSDKDKNILWRMEGDQFGDVQPQVEQVKLPLRHAGQYYDSESGLFYNYFRFYDPKSGRYLRSDPIGLDGGLNTYGYVGGSPLHWTDPFGLYTLNDARNSLINQKAPRTKTVSFRMGLSISTRKIYSDNQIFEEWLRLERANMSWLDELESCPLTINQCMPNEDRWTEKYEANVFHKPGVWEIRSTTTPGGHSNQCVYDSQGALMLNPPAAGSADYKACPSKPCLPHVFHDVIPFNLSEKLNRVGDYYSVRPTK